MHQRLFVITTFYISLFLQTIAVYLYFTVFANTQMAEYIFLITKLILLLIPLLCYKAGMEFLPTFQKRGFLKSIGDGIISGIGMAAFLFLIYLLFSSYFQGIREEIWTKIQDFHVQHWYIGYALLISFVHSAFEEYFWRWYIFSGLVKRMSLFAAMITCSFFFALHHFLVLLAFFPPWTAFIGTVIVAMGGYIWCLIYVQTKNVLGSWISHIFVDLVLYYIGYLIVFDFS